MLKNILKIVIIFLMFKECLIIGFGNSLLTAGTGVYTLGGSFLRYLIQQLTGKLTGSIYDDGDLRVNGFPGESKANERVLVVKTHEWGQKVRSR